MDMRQWPPDHEADAKRPVNSAEEPTHWGAMAQAINDGALEDIEREPANRHERRKAAALARRKVA